MADSSATLHEPSDRLQPATINRHRAIVSLMEELEAVDWYDQRVDATDDPALRDVLAHNRDEEKEHAAMTLEWIRRNDPVWDSVLRMYLFTDAPITEIEIEAEEQEAEVPGAAGRYSTPLKGGDAGGATRHAGTGSLGIGALSDKEGL